jgi:hypothetical protein
LEHLLGLLIVRGRHLKGLAGTGAALPLSEQLAGLAIVEVQLSASLAVDAYIFIRRCVLGVVKPMLDVQLGRGACKYGCAHGNSFSVLRKAAQSVLDTEAITVAIPIRRDLSDTRSTYKSSQSQP